MVDWPDDMTDEQTILLVDDSENDLLLMRGCPLAGR